MDRKTDKKGSSISLKYRNQHSFCLKENEFSSWGENKLSEQNNKIFFKKIKNEEAKYSIFYTDGFNVKEKETKKTGKQTSCRHTERQRQKKRQKEMKVYSQMYILT